jgi:hypothetical protein
MVPDDLKTLANDILRANSEAETYRLVGRLTAKETDAVARLVEMAAMKARVERECAKGRPESS